MSPINLLAAKTAPTRTPLFPLQRGATVGIFTVVDHGAREDLAQIRLAHTLRQQGINILHESVEGALGYKERTILADFMNGMANSGVSTIFMTGGKYDICILAAFRQAALHSVYVKAKPVSFVFYEEALFTNSCLGLCRNQYKDYLGSLPFESDYSLDYGAPLRFGGTGAGQAPPLSISAISGFAALENIVFGSQHPDAVLPRYLPHYTPDFLKHSNIPAAEREGIIRDLALAEESRTGEIAVSYRLISFITDLANEGLLENKAQAEHIRAKLLEILHTPICTRSGVQYHNFPSVLSKAQECRTGYETIYGKITDHENLFRYFDWLAENI